MQSNSTTQTSFYEHGNTLFADTFYCAVANANGTLETKVAKRNDYGVWGISVTLFDYADGMSYQILVVSPAGYIDLQLQNQRPEEDVEIVVAEYQKQYITESASMRLVMSIPELTYLEDVAMPNQIFGRIRFSFEVIAK
ncbi:MAG TPA: hypothetical protein PLZ51_17285 [Aggregatilineales bacterium]|nr:hypothetical protein [Aggregatilineales bacterium]